jgi:hypothetical protein
LLKRSKEQTMGLPLTLDELKIEFNNKHAPVATRSRF